MGTVGADACQHRISEDGRPARVAVFSAVGCPTVAMGPHRTMAKLGPRTDHPWQDRRMSQGFGIEVPRAHSQAPHRKPARFLVVIDSGGYVLARLFIDTREQVAEFDAGSEEAAQMTLGLVPAKGADGPEWDRALEGHSAAERNAAEVYTLEV